MCVGGPMLTVYVMPTDEELFQKYNPELQKRSLERREERQAEFNEWLQNLKRQSMSNKPSTSIAVPCSPRSKLALSAFSVVSVNHI
jgi:hypothetical protein